MKALLLWTSKSLRAARARFSKCLRGSAMSVGPNVGFNTRETILTAPMGIGRWKGLQGKRRMGENMVSAQHPSILQWEKCTCSPGVKNTNPIPPLPAQHQQHHKHCQTEKKGSV